MKQAFAAVDEAFQAFAISEQTPGLAWGVVHKGALAHHGVLGWADVARRRPVDATTRFRIASMTKAFTALALLLLRDDRKLELDDLATQHLPELAANPFGRPVRLRDLLHMTAGLANDDPWADRQLGMAEADLVELIGKDIAYVRGAGMRFEYSNLAYAILGLVIARVAGERYQDFVAARILRPLGLEDTGFATSDDDHTLALPYRIAAGQLLRESIEADGAFAAIGGLVTTVADFARWTAALLNAFCGNPARPLSTATVAELGEVHGGLIALRQPGAGGPSAGGYAAGLVANIDEALGMHFAHAGGLPGYGSHVLLVPEQDFAVFGFANRTYAPVYNATYAAARLLAETHPAQPSQELAAAAQAITNAITGRDPAPILQIAADNLFRDVPTSELRAALESASETMGGLSVTSLAPEHRHAGVLTLTGERGAARVRIMLAPLKSGAVQRLTWLDDER